MPCTYIGPNCFGLGQVVLYVFKLFSTGSKRFERVQNIWTFKIIYWKVIFGPFQNNLDKFKIIWAHTNLYQSKIVLDLKRYKEISNYTVLSSTDFFRTSKQRFFGLWFNFNKGFALLWNPIFRLVCGNDLLFDMPFRCVIT